MSLGAGLAFGGCAAQKAAPSQAAVVELPAESAPAPAGNHADEAREPWSPEYGTRPRIDDPAVAPTQAPNEAGATRIATMDADALIRHAVAQHEMRRP